MICAATAAAAANDQKSGGGGGGATNQQLQVIINDSVDGSFPPRNRRSFHQKRRKSNTKMKEPVAFFQLISESDLIAVFGCCCCGADSRPIQRAVVIHFLSYCERTARKTPAERGLPETERSRRGQFAHLEGQTTSSRRSIIHQTLTRPR